MGFLDGPPLGPELPPDLQADQQKRAALTVALWLGGIVLLGIILRKLS